MNYRRVDGPNIEVDAVMASVIQGALENIAVEMGYKLMRMSYSSIIRESEDFGAGLVDAKGRGLAESAQSTPLQSGPIPGYVRGMMRVLNERGETLRPGDVIMHNDAYAGASHGPDVAFIVPVFVGDALAGYSVTTAHHLDIGALTPGSCGIVDAIDAYAEGLQFRAIKVYDEGRPVVPVWHMLRDNIRASDLVVGDMEAQVAASRIGAERLRALIERYGTARFEAACESVMDHADRLMRSAIAKLPDGVYRAETRIDGFLDSPDPAKRELPLVASVIVQGDEMTVDLTGTADQVPDRPINMPLVGTVDVAVWLTVRSVLLDTAVHGHIPVNDGLTRAIRIVAPRGCLANPIFPAPTIARFCPGNQLADTVMRALGQVVPKQISAGIGNLRVLAFSGLDGETHWVHMEICEGSYGDGKASTAWTRSTPSTPTPATTRSRTWSLTSPCASAATSCARTSAAPASGGEGSARSASSPTSPTAGPRSRGKAIASRPGASTAATTACRPACSAWARAETSRSCRRRFPTPRPGPAIASCASAPPEAATGIP